MDDERIQLEADVRVRDALMPDDVATRRVVERALAADGAPANRGRRLRLALAVAALALVVGASSFSVWRSRRLPSPAVASAPLALIGTGSMVVVEHPDGRRWMIGPPPERRIGGNYVIAIHK